MVFLQAKINKMGVLVMSVEANVSCIVVAKRVMIRKATSKVVQSKILHYNEKAALMKRPRVIKNAVIHHIT